MLTFFNIKKWRKHIAIGFLSSIPYFCFPNIFVDLFILYYVGFSHVDCHAVIKVSYPSLRLLVNHSPHIVTHMGAHTRIQLQCWLSSSQFPFP